MSAPDSGLSRRTLLQAAGASALAAYATFGAAGTARAADDHPVADRVVIHPIPSGVPTNNSFSVKVRTPQGEWQPVGVYLATLKIINEKTGSGAVKRSSVAFLDFSGTVEVAVTSSKGAFEKARIRPLSYGIEYTADGDTLTFTLTEPRALSIEIDGEIFDNLHLNANPIETNRPDRDDPDVIYYGPGLHTVSGNILEGGAVLRARVSFNGVSNARAVGRGVVWDAPAGSFGILRSNNIEINGLTSLSPRGHAVRVDERKQVTISGLHAYSSATWGDGVDVTVIARP